MVISLLKGFIFGDVWTTKACTAETMFTIVSSYMSSEQTFKSLPMEGQGLSQHEYAFLNTEYLLYFNQMLWAYINHTQWWNHRPNKGIPNG